MGKEPDPHAYHPNSMDLNDAADMRDEAEQAFNDARKTRGKRDLLYVAVMACVIVMLTGVPGAIMAPYLIKLLKIENPVIQGICIGTASRS